MKALIKQSLEGAVYERQKQDTRREELKALIKQSLEGAVYERQKQDTRREVKMGMIFAVMNTT